MTAAPPWENDELMKRALGALRRRAASRRHWSYSEFGAEIGLDMANPRDRDWMSGLLGSLSGREVGKGRPMISAIVGRAADMVPGPGFFEAARALGRMRADEQPEAYWRRELEIVWDYWAKRREAARKARAEGGDTRGPSEKG